MKTKLRTALVVAALAAAAQAAPGAEAQTGGTTPLPVRPAPLSTAFDGNGMWVWYLSRSNRGNLDSIAARAQRAGITTLFIKSSDGTHRWGQFNARVVRALHARGLDACAWGYVYGRSPTAEARAARSAIAAGADCFVIDAEAEYEGRYVAADVYMRKLRAYAGRDYPIGVAPFPYVDYHPAYPYSVFLGPDGAQFNVPQMYWRAIGTSVKEVYRHTYAYNTLYTRPIYPLGQTYGGVPKRDVVRFRQLAVSYGARGVSWWSWQATPSSAWSGLAAPLDAYPAATPKPGLPATLKRGARGDLVVWAQQHLLSAGKRVPVNGVLDLRTRSAVRAVQRAKGLPVTGALDPATWRVLLANPPAKVRWRRGGATPTTRKPPRSATAPAKRNELRAKPGP